MAENRPTWDRWKHDLKNQLGIIIGFSELLLQDMDGVDSRRADVQEIHTAAQRALETLSVVPWLPEKEEGAR